ncbi:hypothetical protein AM501_29490 [Aneurinibacillus migulanus]|uniref:hypothetical protein n=1 Tax=Aneurinibacillus migulanus TaxID=47500 RepID=UPI0005BDD808|nr:hypothetical protein [Aneurinibacillus migulanus]KIV56874.1 hypothetical protein TS64_08930 [Aneurinibacillus migulanus]KPD04853.1 hypothetical protein AM501_29490 [Aneurinibacillus migulanus]
MEKEEDGYALRPGRKKADVFVPTAPAHRPSFFFYLLPQEYVNLQSDIYSLSHPPHTLTYPIKQATFLLSGLFKIKLIVYF